MNRQYLDIINDRINGEIDFNKNEKSIDSSYEFYWLCSFPDTYKNAMQNIGGQNVYYNVKSHSNVFADRIYLKDEEISKNYEPISYELKMKPRDFNVISFSLGYEGYYMKMLEMLSDYQIPLLRDERTENDPLIVVGGYAVSYNPLSISNFVDIVIIGDLGTSLDDMNKIMTQHNYRNKEEFLSLLTKVQGVYIPSLNNKVKRSYEEVLIERNYFTIANGADTYFYEHYRGCANFCRYCVMSYFQARPRFKDNAWFEDVASKISGKVKHVHLVGASDNESPFIKEIYDICQKYKLIPVVGTQRVDKITRNNLELLMDNQERISISPETASYRLQNIIGKNLDVDNIIEKVKHIETGRVVDILNVNMLFGIPTETMDDIESNIKFIREIRKNLDRKIRISVSFNVVIPKPFTPFQWAPQIQLDEYYKKSQYMMQEIGELENTICRIMGISDYFAQGLLARGDERMSGVLINALGNDYDDINMWQDALAKNNIDYQEIFREKDTTESLPWEIIIESPIKREILVHEWKQAKNSIPPKRKCNLSKCCNDKKCTMLAYA